MAFRVYKAQLMEEMSLAISKLVANSFSQSAPTELHHYTGFEGLCGITRSRAFWAKSLTEQADQQELDYGISLLKEEIETRKRDSIPPFAGRVLNLVPGLLEDRKKWTFIACFCDDDDSPLHWEKYGKYRLTISFPRNRAQTFQPMDLSAEYFSRPVLYDSDEHYKIIKEAVSILIDCFARFSGGDENQGPFNWMEIGCARDAAQLLLDIVVGFKRPDYASEREWRLVCHPEINLGSTAYLDAERSLVVHVREAPRRLELRILHPLRASGLAIPILRIRRDLSESSEPLINLLRQCDRDDIQCE